MPHGYCTECRAQVTVRGGRCLLDHLVDPTTIEETPGRRLRGTARRPRGAHIPRAPIGRPLPSVSLAPLPQGGGVALLERATAPASDHETPAIDLPASRFPSNPDHDAAPLSLTGLLVEELWNLGPDEDILGWTPGELDATLEHTGMRMRKPLALAALVVALTAVGWRALTWDDSRLAESIQAVTSASGELVANVRTLETPVADLADGAVTDPLLASTSLARLDGSARVLFAVAGDMPAESEMAAVREQAIAQAAGALELGTTLSESVAYSAAVELITRPVDLPAETDFDGLRTVTETVTSWVGEFTTGVQSLPGNEVTDTHRTALTDLAASLPEWQASYLDALRARDTERAAGHVAELQTQIAFVRDSWQDTAASIAVWAGERIETLAVPLVINR